MLACESRPFLRSAERERQLWIRIVASVELASFLLSGSGHLPFDWKKFRSGSHPHELRIPSKPVSFLQETLLQIHPASSPSSHPCRNSVESCGTDGEISCQLLDSKANRRRKTQIQRQIGFGRMNFNTQDAGEKD